MSLVAGPSNSNNSTFHEQTDDMFHLLERETQPEPESKEQLSILSAHFGLAPYPTEEPPEEELELCKDWEQGNCNKGEKCRFRHAKVSATKRKARGATSFNAGWLTNLATKAREVAQEQKANDDSDDEGKQSSSQNAKELVVEDRDEALDRMFEELGSRRRQEQADEKSTAGEEGVLVVLDSSESEEDWDVVDSDKEAKTNKQSSSSPEVINLVSAEELEARRLEEAAAIEQYIVLQSSMVTCGAGLEIRRVVPGYDLRQLLIKNVPLDANKAEIEAIILAHDGVSKLDFYILELKESGQTLQAVVISNAEHSSGLAATLNGTVLHERRLIFEVFANATWTTGSMEVNQPSLTLTWQAPDPGARGLTTYNFERDLASLYERLYDSKGVHMDSSYLVTPESDSSKDVTLTVDFDNWDNLQAAVRNIEANRPSKVPSLRCTHAKPQQHSITIPLDQYSVQSNQWTALADTKNPRNARIDLETTNAAVVVRVTGDDKTAVGALKVRVEKLAGGEILDGVHWHPSFALAEDSESFFRDVRKAARVEIRRDPPIRAVRLYGDPQDVERARQMVRDEAHRRAQVKTRTALTDVRADFFVREGIGRLQELVGEDNADLMITARWTAIMMRGGDEATHHLERLLEESRTATVEDADNNGVQCVDTCPICFTDVLNPERLGCGHAYCAGCFNSFLAAAANNKVFPIICMGKDGNCGVPIALPFLRRFLPHETFKVLVEAAFANYLERNPQEFRYCRTPDCRQTYRKQPQERATSIQCPSCFLAFCSGCEQDHPRMTCQEYRLSRDEAEQERLNGQLAQARGYQRCPRCAVWIEKIDGCNHMTCKCGAHICWICLGVFGVGEIYPHIRSTHPNR